MTEDSEQPRVPQTIVDPQFVIQEYAAQNQELAYKLALARGAVQQLQAQVAATEARANGHQPKAPVTVSSPRAVRRQK